MEDIWGLKSRSNIVVGDFNHILWGNSYSVLNTKRIDLSSNGLKGEIDPESGYLVDMKVLSDIIEENICKKFDHKNLNLDTTEFKNLIPTAENIAVVIWNILREKIDKKLKLSIKLFETPRNFVEYSG